MNNLGLELWIRGLIFGDFESWLDYDVLDVYEEFQFYDSIYTELGGEG